MKYIYIILGVIICFSTISCKKEISLISSVKETVIRGVPSKHPYIQYKLEFEVLQEDAQIKIQQITFPLLGIQNDELKYDIMDLKSNLIVSEINGKGRYVINIIPKSSAQGIVRTKKLDEIEISWLLNNVLKKTKISSFVEKTKRIR
ncbi:hypothetical protein J8L88_16000 [Aquimarina sp. MMG015]|uniref:hypothetical protein n=1 Tax=Aquimarina sp. MMG015 TaxID=2822689 RepID=UPI001B3A41C8|nr:hypothetical protein [Aquimarina sp. MMG015]MBQ4804368.1 hypothetical protein [Aquimarina sp. MMG015]